MQRIGAALWPNLRCIQIYGANTDVGKTIVSSILGTALRNRNVQTNYIKPVSAGSIDDADHRYADNRDTTNSFQSLILPRHISKFVPGAKFKTLFQLSQPLSPHLAAQKDGKVINP
jgi:dethiobiotin synthetase/adenosylmethionine--8-amino-7-oxononanoate aminotransferase